MAVTDVQDLMWEEAPPRGPGRARRIIVTALGIALALAACAIMGIAFAQGSWWYLYMDDRPLDAEARARVEAIRDDLEATGAVPQAVVWLNAALDPSADPTAVRNRLLAAQELLKAADDPDMAEVARELWQIAQATWPGAAQKPAISPDMPEVELP